MTTQKKAIQNILDSLDSIEFKRIFILNWLEDINWHTEHQMFRDQFSAIDREIVDALCDWKIKNDAGCDMGTDTHIHVGSKLYRRDLLVHNLKITDFYIAVNYIFSWGLDNDSWRKTNGQSLVDELMSIC